MFVEKCKLLVQKVFSNVDPSELKREEVTSKMIVDYINYNYSSDLKFCQLLDELEEGCEDYEYNPRKSEEEVTKKTKDIVTTVDDLEKMRTERIEQIEKLLNYSTIEINRDKHLKFQRSI